MTGPIPFRSGDFVWTRFPFENEPDEPGLVRHAACVIAAFTQQQAGAATSADVPARGLVVGVYTSSKVGKFGDALPIGVIQVGREQASRLGGQVAFFIDVRKRAFLPYTRKFFPDIDEPGCGLIAPASRTLFDEVKRQYLLVNQRHQDLIVNVGPLRPPGT